MRSNLMVQHVTQIKNCQCESKRHRTCKNNCSWNSCTCICENSKYSKSIVDHSVIACDGILSGTNSV